ncbi:carbohydrate ABC transporter permease [Salinarchaeum laminariae]|uniref:carbohydrate ABC transporter permease n=1 Tax=Salinarchaeum laminariae TaxID=869888 RepID=UPI0020C01836|nr:carbohydrate ABC transporter permease [Salinarchaeum laminariae]
MTDPSHSDGAESRIANALDGTSWVRAGLYASLFVIAVLYLLPLWSAIATSLKTVTGFANTAPFVPPGFDQFTLDAWSSAWETLNPSIINSAMFVIPATIIVPILGSLAAFGLTITNWRGQLALYTLFIAGIFVPLQSVLVPLSIIWSNASVEATLASLGPLNVWELPYTQRYQAQFIELAVTHIAFGIPLATLLFRSHYKDMSEEMIEAARLEGVSIYRIYLNIVLPLSRPVFVVVMILAFTTIWNDLLFALVLVSNPAAEPVTVTFSGIAGAKVQQFNTIMAGGFLTALPTLIVYVLFTRQFAEGFSQTGA